MMNFDLDHSITLLSKTPSLLRAWLAGLPDEWLHTRGPGESWSPYDVLGHLIHGERTDWVPRAEIILYAEGDRQFQPFDRFAQFEESQGKSLDQLLTTFERLRSENLERVRGFNLKPPDFDRTGIHPELGEVDLGQLLATWVTHDLNHIGQIAEVMARHYRDEVGPWLAYIDILG